MTSQLNGHEFEQTLGDGEGQGSLVCCSPWGRKESDMTQSCLTLCDPMGFLVVMYGCESLTLKKAEH